MIAPRPKRPHQTPPITDEPLHETLVALASSGPSAYGTWHEYASEADALSAIVSEIGQVVLARRITVLLNETGGQLELIVSNRHLIQLGGVSFDPTQAASEDVLHALRSALTGSRSLKFEVAERNPPLPQNTRSWPFAALWQELSNGSPGASENTGAARMTEDIKALSRAWIDHPAQADCVEGGEQECLAILKRFSEMCSSPDQESDPFPVACPRLVMVPIAGQGLLVDVTCATGNFLAFCDAQNRGQLISLWREFVGQAG